MKSKEYSLGKQLSDLSPAVRSRVERWLDVGICREELLAQLHNNPLELEDAFFQDLSFGTGGLRGLTGIGTNRINHYTIENASQGLASFLKAKHSQEQLSVVIAYDSRASSYDLAYCALRTFVANGFHVYFFSALRPVPLLSFACRHLGCAAGVMITASHNPPTYNGYKVYGADGAQVVAPDDREIVAAVHNVNKSMARDPEEGEVTFLGAEFDEVYYRALASLHCAPELTAQHGKELKVVYTSLHGTGITMVPSLLKSRGFSSLQTVTEQESIDGTFSTAPSPNPEEYAAMERGVALLEEGKGDILLGTDPDADRVGVVVWHRGAAYQLTGNQVASLCLDYICSELTKKGTMPPRAAFVKTIVTTELFRAILEHYGLECFDVFTGFKYIAALIRQWEGEERQFIFGAEESSGFLFGDLVRDKDGVSSCALIAEVALAAKRQGRTLVDQLHYLYSKYGVFREQLLSLSFTEGKKGLEQREQVMASLREAAPTGWGVCSIKDYAPESNVLQFGLEGKGKVIIRPSGTEPKIKVYCSVEGSSVEACDDRLEAMVGVIDRSLRLIAGLSD